MADFSSSSGVTLRTNVSGHREQRVEYGSDVVSGNAIPYIRTVDANTGEELDRYFLINDGYLMYDGSKLISPLPFEVRSTLNVTGDATMAGSLNLTSTRDAQVTADNNPPLIIGNRNGTHLEIDNNEILAKSNASTTSTIYINNEGGGNIATSGSILLNNAKSYYIKDSSGKDWIVAGINASNGMYYGYGSYTNSSGSVNYYGNTINIVARSTIRFNSNPLFKTATTSISLGAIAAGSGFAKTGTATTMSGYKVVGMIGFTITNNQAGTIGACYVDSSNVIHITGTNRASSAWASTATATVTCLYMLSATG